MLQSKHYNFLLHKKPVNFSTFPDGTLMQPALALSACSRPIFRGNFRHNFTALSSWALSIYHWHHANGFKTLLSQVLE